MYIRGVNLILEEDLLLRGTSRTVGDIVDVTLQ